MTQEEKTLLVELLAAALSSELNRLRRLELTYVGDGDAPRFVRRLIREKIELGEAALASGDSRQMRNMLKWRRKFKTTQTGV